MENKIRRQVDYLIVDDEIAVDFYLKQESLIGVADTLKCELDIKIGALPKLNVTKKTNTDTLNQLTLSKVKCYFEEDYKAFEYD